VRARLDHASRTPDACWQHFAVFEAPAVRALVGASHYSGL